MKTFKNGLSALAFVFAVGAVFAFQPKTSEDLTTVTRYEQLSASPCVLISRQCSDIQSPELCAVEDGILRMQGDCASSEEETFIFKP